MHMILDFVPQFCPNCGHAFIWAMDAVREFRHGEGHTCLYCEVHYAYVSSSVFNQPTVTKEMVVYYLDQISVSLAEVIGYKLNQSDASAFTFSMKSYGEVPINNIGVSFDVTLLRHNMQTEVMIVIPKTEIMQVWRIHGR